jgi:hypothetical protein
LFDDPINTIAERRLIYMMIAHVGDRFATQILGANLATLFRPAS